MSVFKVRNVAFIGTGIMGAPIAGHIMDAGFKVTVYNRTRAKAEALLARGAQWADTPAEAAKHADVVFTMVGYPTDVEDVYLGADGILEVAPKGSYLIDLTTSSPQLARELHDAAEVMDKHAFDCPVTGGEEGAVAGTLTLIVGADERTAAPACLMHDWLGRRACACPPRRDRRGAHARDALWWHGWFRGAAAACPACC